MSYPDWALKHKKPNTQICFIRGKYYLYSHTSVWCPIRKRTKKITTGYLGRLDEAQGLIPKGTVKRGRKPKGASLPPFLDDVADLPDSRKDRGKRYSLAEVFLCALLATLCGAEGWQDIENYSKANLAFLRSFFPFVHGAPSDDTLRRIFGVLDVKAFKTVFQNWVSAFALSLGSQVLAIDGKCARRSYDGKDSAMLHQVHALSASSKLVIGQEKVADKSNEITAIPKLLEAIDVQGQIITVDALGCQYEIANLIQSKGADFIFSLKGNQGTLQEDVQLFFEKASQEDPIQTKTHVDKGHGRIEERICSVCHDTAWLHERHPHWCTIHSIIRVQSHVEKGDKKTSETRYYISSLQKDPLFTLNAIRDHWAVEAFHWVLDMSFNEDYLRTRKGNAAEVMSILRHMAYNMLTTFMKGEDNSRLSLKGLRKLCGWNQETLLNVVKSRPNS